jgi:hypothetical protein
MKKAGAASAIAYEAEIILRSQARTSRRRVGITTILCTAKPIRIDFPGEGQPPANERLPPREANQTATLVCMFQPTGPTSGRAEPSLSCGT